MPGHDVISRVHLNRGEKQLSYINLVADLESVV